jgi:hypothetical protein
VRRETLNVVVSETLVRDRGKGFPHEAGGHQQRSGEHVRFELQPLARRIAALAPIRLEPPLDVHQRRKAMTELEMADHGGHQQALAIGRLPGIQHQRRTVRRGDERAGDVGLEQFTREGGRSREASGDGVDGRLPDVDAIDEAAGGAALALAVDEASIRRASRAARIAAASAPIAARDPWRPTPDGTGDTLSSSTTGVQDFRQLHQRVCEHALMPQLEVGDPRPRDRRHDARGHIALREASLEPAAPHGAAELLIEGLDGRHIGRICQSSGGRKYC